MSALRPLSTRTERQTSVMTTGSPLRRGPDGCHDAATAPVISPFQSRLCARRRGSPRRAGSPWWPGTGPAHRTGYTGGRCRPGRHWPGNRRSRPPPRRRRDGPRAPRPRARCRWRARRPGSRPPGRRGARRRGSRRSRLLGGGALPVVPLTPGAAALGEFGEGVGGGLVDECLRLPRPLRPGHEVHPRRRPAAEHLQDRQQPQEHGRLGRGRHEAPGDRLHRPVGGALPRQAHSDGGTPARARRPG